jgi:hypothetical protein
MVKRRSNRRWWSSVVAYLFIVSVLLVAVLLFPVDRSIQSAATQESLSETRSQAAVTSLGNRLVGAFPDPVVLKGATGDVASFVFLAVGFLGVTVGGGWACFYWAREGSNLRILGVILLGVSVVAIPAFAAVGRELFSNRTVTLTMIDDGVELRANAWGSSYVEQGVPVASSPRFVVYPAKLSDGPDRIAFVWDSDGEVHALWLCSFSGGQPGERRGDINRFMQRLALTTNLPCYRQRDGKEPELIAE